MFISIKDLYEFIQGDSGRKDDNLRGDSTGHCAKKKVPTNV